MRDERLSPQYSYYILLIIFVKVFDNEKMRFALSLSADNFQFIRYIFEVIIGIFHNGQHSNHSAQTPMPPADAGKCQNDQACEKDIFKTCTVV